MRKGGDVIDTAIRSLAMHPKSRRAPSRLGAVELLARTGGTARDSTPRRRLARAPDSGACSTALTIRATRSHRAHDSRDLRAHSPLARGALDIILLNAMGASARGLPFDADASRHRADRVESHTRYARGQARTRLCDDAAPAEKRMNGSLCFEAGNMSIISGSTRRS